jgi:hypothetical protein
MNNNIVIDLIFVSISLNENKNHNELPHENCIETFRAHYIK